MSDADNLRVQSLATERLDPSLKTSSPSQIKNDQIGKEQFLTLLVTQLKNQDPLDPMKNEDFAVNLAQFSQLEQLIAIKEKLTSGGSDTGMTSMASYLGHEVLLNSSTVEARAGNAGSISFELPTQSANTRVDLLDADGTVRASLELGALQAGNHTIALEDPSIPSGEYEVRVEALSGTGSVITPPAYVAGLVSGFIPGPEPMLMVNGREVSPGEIREVRLPQGA